MQNAIEILIVEDSPVQAKHLKQLLEKHAYQVSVAHNGEEALAAIHQRRPTLVISDIVMPRMDGYELCRRIKADRSLGDLPVVLLTQLSEPGDVVEGLECGADNFMTKPYDERTLLSRIQYILANQALRTSATSEMGLEIFFAGKKHFITSGRMQIVDLLLSTYESAVQKTLELQQANRRLITAEHELRVINEQLQREITERMQAEQALQTAHDELEIRVEERTAELKQANDALQVEITERMRAEEALEQRVHELVALNTLAERVSAKITLNQVVKSAIDGTVAAVNADLVLVFLRNGNELLLQDVGPAISRFAHDEIPLHRVGECLCGLAVSQGQPLWSDDIHCDPRCTWDECKQAGLHSFAALPLRSGDDIIGVLGLASGTERDFREQSTFLEALAGEIAIGIRNAILYEQVRRHAAEMEQRVADRTAELAVAKERAESADRLKSAFLATMSHELRTPLNSIIGFTGIMLQGLAGGLNAEQTKQLGMIQSSAHHLLNLINDVLDISKIEAGQLEIAREPFDMRETIEKVVRTVTPQAEKKELALVAEVAPEVGQVVSDRRRVEQILINLLTNAVKFTEKGEVRVECQVSDGWLVTRVGDTGIGIKPEDMGKLFEAFRQIDIGLTRRHEGTGLGLSICKKLVEMLGGEIRAESEGAGKGSTFTFTLPGSLSLQG